MEMFVCFVVGTGPWSFCQDTVQVYAVKSGSLFSNISRHWHKQLAMHLGISMQPQIFVADVVGGEVAVFSSHGLLDTVLLSLACWRISWILARARSICAKGTHNFERWHNEKCHAMPRSFFSAAKHCSSCWRRCEEHIWIHLVRNPTVNPIGRLRAILRALARQPHVLSFLCLSLSCCHQNNTYAFIDESFNWCCWPSWSSFRQLGCVIPTDAVWQGLLLKVCGSPNWPVRRPNRSPWIRSMHDGALASSEAVDVTLKSGQIPSVTTSTVWLEPGSQDCTRCTLPDFITVAHVLPQYFHGSFRRVWRTQNAMKSEPNVEGRHNQFNIVMRNL